MAFLRRTCLGPLVKDFRSKDRNANLLSMNNDSNIDICFASGNQNVVIPFLNEEFMTSVEHW